MLTASQRIPVRWFEITDTFSDLYAHQAIGRLCRGIAGIAVRSLGIQEFLGIERRHATSAC